MQYIYRFLVGCLSFLLLCLGGCDNNNSSTLEAESVMLGEFARVAEFSVTAAEGGQLAIPGGALLTIPPAALSEDTVIRVHTPPDQDANTQVVKFKFEPSGLQFLLPAMLTIPYADVDAQEPLITAHIWSLNHVEEDVGSELNRWEDAEVLNRDHNGNTLSLQLDHFSLVYLYVAVDEYAYIVKDIPPKYLNPGDILFTLTKLTGKRGPDWRPGHVGLFAGGGEACSPDVSERIIEATPPRVRASTLSIFKREFGHRYLGARIPLLHGPLSFGDRQGVSIFAENQIGEMYFQVGEGNLDNASFSCVGLAEAAYDSIDKGSLPIFTELTASVPIELFLTTSPVVSVVVGAGELIEVPIEGVIVHPATPDLNDTFRGFYCSSGRNCCDGSHCNTYQIDLTGGHLPDGATFEQQADGSGIVRWQTRPEDAGRTVFLSFTLTSNPTIRAIIGSDRESLGTVTAEDTLHIEVVPCGDDGGGTTPGGGIDGPDEERPDGDVDEPIVTEAAVRLDHSLGVGSAFYAQYETIALSRIDGVLIVDEEPGCDAKHLHATSEVGIFIDGLNGPFPDPNQPGCGFGKIVQIPVNSTANP